MKISELIENLQIVQARSGDLNIAHEDYFPLSGNSYVRDAHVFMHTVDGKLVMEVRLV